MVFLNENDYNKFKNKEYFKKIILPSKWEAQQIITFKKFYALKELQNTYLYYIVCDSEIDIIDENFTYENIIEKINKFYNNKKIFSGEFEDNKWGITKTSSNIFKTEYDKNKLKDLTNNYKLFYWWSDLPVFKGSHLNDFFDKINSEFPKMLFDHKVYLNYLVLYHNFKFVNITPLIGRKWSLENYNDNDINNIIKLNEESYTFSWIIRPFFKNHKEYLIKNGSFLLYHLDRHK